MHHLSLLLPGLAFALPLAAQVPLATDLWRVAAGTETRPGALAEGALAPFWTPAVVLADSVRVRAGIESIHAPEEIGVTGATAALLLRSRAGTLAFTYGRVGLDDIVRTETSPEAVGGNVPAWASAASAGLARRFGDHAVAGLAARVLSGRLGDQDERRLALDFGVTWSPLPRTRAGFATRYFDPLLGRGAAEASYIAGLTHTLPAFDAWGAPARLEARYGLAAQRGEAVQHLLAAGLVLARILALDVGAAREAVAGESYWRTRFGIGLVAGHYHIDVGRDGGVNGFGATYRFGLTAEYP